MEELFHPLKSIEKLVSNVIHWVLDKVGQKRSVSK